MNPNESSTPPAANGAGDREMSRRKVLQLLGLGGAATAATAAVAATPGGETLRDAMGDYFQDHYQRMSPQEVKEALERLERIYRRRYGVEVKVGNTPPKEGVLFGYALNIDKCKGYRECVRACVEENNCSTDDATQYIRVLEIDKGTLNFEESDHYYDASNVPRPGKWYLPVACQHCENPPCVEACPVGATWKEKDGIVVVDYNWCIGCRYCQTACPYWARHFNWTKPRLDPDHINPNTEYLSNRPRRKGAMEKCTFCLHRTRNGRMPACQEACPTGARIFGNLLDPKSEIRYVLENKSVFRLKEDLNTEPKFWYFAD